MALAGGRMTADRTRADIRRAVTRRQSSPLRVEEPSWGAIPTLRQPGRFEPSQAALLLRMQRTLGNHAVQRLLQRTPLSDDLAAASKGKSAREVLALLTQKKFKDGAQDPAE